MHFTLADTILGLTGGQLALLFSGVVIVFTIRHWRRTTLRNQATQQAEEPRREFPAPVSMHQPLDIHQPSPQRTALNVREVAIELSALLADLEETSRRVAAQIDNRKMALEQLIAEADEKIMRLEALTRQPMPAVQKPASTSPSSFAPGLSGMQKPTAVAPAKTTSAAQDAAQTLTRLRQERGAPTPTDDPAYRPIYQLADLGKTPREIAQELNRQPGEVELILALRSRQRV